MDSATEDILFQKIEELVLDDDRIVTYSVLCENLNISLTEAKLILEKYISDQVSPGKFSLTYIICGKLKTGGYGIQIAESNLLEDKKKLFETIKNEIVYSIQKSNKVDFNLIASVENESENALKGSIVSEKCRECTLKTRVLPPLPPQKNFEKQKPSFFKHVSKPLCDGDEDKIKTEPMSSKNNFKIQKVMSQNNKKSGCLTSFLSQSTQKETKKNNSEHDSSKESSVVMEDIEITSNVQKEGSNEKVLKNNDEKENLSSIKNGDVLQKKKQKSVIDKTSNSVQKKEKIDQSKKRKRIIMDSDSDDDLFGNNEDEKMVLEESDEEQAVVKPTPLISVPKNKRRKAVEKTYEDEEGFIVTRTEYILVSASEDEESETQKKTEVLKMNKPDLKEEKKSSVPKTASKKKGKALVANQSSITNFFRKK